MATEAENRTIAVVTYKGAALLDLVATKKVLDRLAKASRYRSVSVGGRTEPTDSDTPLRIIPEKRFQEVSDPFALVVPGGGMDALKAMGGERLLDHLRFAAYGAELVASVSGGIDAMLELAAKLTSEATAKRMQIMIEYDPEPPFGAVDWGEADESRPVETLIAQRADLEEALAGRPDLYRKVFG